MSASETPSAREDAALRQRERRLCAAAASRNVDALEQIIAENTERFLNFGASLAGDRDDGLDLCQEALAAITSTRVLDRFRGERPLGAYLWRVGTNEMLSRFRAIRRRREHDLSVGDISERADLAGPELEYGPSELSGPVREAFTALPAQAQAVVLHLVFGELSYEETAEAVGLKLGTVKSVYHRARVSLQRALIQEA